MKLLNIKTIALLEATKGVLALIVALGVHTLAGIKFQTTIENIVTHLHLNPANQLPNLIINAVKDISNVKLVLLSMAAILYALVRFIEAYGLWKRYRWTEWFALISGAVYLPMEAYEFIHTTSLLSAIILLINSIIVLYMYKTISGLN
jgi:uncharacterized membrane protein (DUF2068 family)